MVNRQAFRDEILALPVWDTHTHLVPEMLAAQTFWDIGHYFWFLRELQAAGYPRHPDELPLEQRIAAYLQAFDATRNTSMNWVVRQIFKTLYGIEIVDAQSIRDADQAVRLTAQQTDWPARVLDKLAIRRICLHGQTHREFPHLPGIACTVPVDANLDWNDLVNRVYLARERHTAADQAAAEIARNVCELAQAGITCVRAPTSPFEQLGLAAYDQTDAVPAAGARRREVEVWLANRLFRALAQQGIAAQLFLGVELTSGGQRVALNDTSRIVNLHGLFAKHPDCRFELVIGSELNNLDAVQAARVYPNVHVGGMWWYNFRASTYRQSMQYRIEALPSCKCALIASDARCIEWCYGKILLVKRLMADFLFEQIELDWLDHDQALRVARDWLHDAAARLYVRPPG
jgi:hypothetical protein